MWENDKISEFYMQSGNVKRLTASAIDYSVCYMTACIIRLLFVITIPVLYIRGIIPFFVYNQVGTPVGKLGEGAGIQTLIFAYGLLSWDGIAVYINWVLFVYCVMCEWIADGKTIGKRQMHLQIVRTGSEDSLFWKMKRIFLKIVCLKFWYITLIYYVQMQKMPYDVYLGITEKGGRKPVNRME